MGGIVAGVEDDKLLLLANYGKNLGLAFQIMDDVIEAKEGKIKEKNYATILGIEEAKRKAEEAIIEAKNSLHTFEDSKILTALAEWCIKRKK